jgi:hypothetical protein
VVPSPGDAGSRASGGHPIRGGRHFRDFRPYARLPRQHLKAWLVPRAKKHGPVVPLANVPNAIQKLVAAVNADPERKDDVSALTPAPSPVRRARGTEIGTSPLPSPSGPAKETEGDTSPLPSSQCEDGEEEEKFAWKHNALRHSFCSYRLAFVKSAAEVALEAGNSPQMIFRHYPELVTEDEAKAWFAIEPKTPTNVTAMPRREKKTAVTA